MALAVVVVVFAAATARLFVWPATDSAERADAVVLFAGGRGERLTLAQQLMDDGVADTLVIPNGREPEWPAGNEACTNAHDYTVVCPRPEPDTTRGEARAIAELAEDGGWRTVIVVTSSYQLSRAGMLLSRCFDGDVMTVRASPELNAIDWVRRVGHEWLAWTRAMTVQRRC